MSHQESSNKQIIELFREYYRKANLKLPEDFVLREFAIQPFNSSTYIRHLSFQKTDDLLSFIEKNTPKHLYYSSARYENPGLKDMESKKWLGADLVFDIDADHIPGCTEVKIWLCPNGHGGTGDQSTCPVCGAKTKKISIIDDECLVKGLDQVLRLADILIEDFGFNENDINIYFSGHRGFHLHVHLDDKLAQMGSEERREIVDYILGIGLSIESLRLANETRGRSRRLALIPRINDYGWRRRISKSLLETNIDNTLKKYIIGETPPSHLTIMSKIEDTIPWAIDHSKVFVDEKVTIDTKRLIRIPFSLNGKTGLIVKELSIKNPLRFSPSLDVLSPFKGIAKFTPDISLKNIRILGRKISLEKHKTHTLELGLAVYLELKGIGKITRIQR